MWHVREYRDGASSRVAKQRGVAVMLKGEALCIQEILRCYCRTDFGEEDILNWGRENAGLSWRQTTWSTVLQTPVGNPDTNGVKEESMMQHFPVRTTQNFWVESRYRLSSRISVVINYRSLKWAYMTILHTFPRYHNSGQSESNSQNLCPTNMLV